MLFNSEHGSGKSTTKRFCRRLIDPNTADHVFSTLSKLVSATKLAAIVAPHNLDLAGRMRFGPDVEWVDREYYEVDPKRSASFYERITGRVSLSMIRPSWLIFTGPGRQKRIAAVARIAVHRLAALIGFILSLPIIIVTAILIKLDSRGPVFYKQERVGRNGRTFVLTKFRSMKVDAEKEGPVWASKGDDRTTRVGRIIRKIRVDEIPQFWNIIKGDMNFVGPRPERPHFVAQLAEEIPYYEQRHLIAPGLTGWAQIKYPYGASIEDARQKLQYDLLYIKNHGLVFDAIILFETVKIILFGRGAQ